MRRKEIWGQKSLVWLLVFLLISLITWAMFCNINKLSHPLLSFIYIYRYIYNFLIHCIIYTCRNTYMYIYMYVCIDICEFLDYIILTFPQYAHSESRDHILLLVFFFWESIAMIQLPSFFSLPDFCYFEYVSSPTLRIK